TDLLCISIVLFLQAINLLLQALIFRTLGPINCHPVCAKHHVQKKPDRQNSDCSGSDPPPYGIHALQKGFDLCTGSLSQGFSVVRTLGQRPQPLLGRGKNPDFWQTYSKIHCLAAALSFFRSSALGASE